MELREKRLDQEDVLADFQKNIDELKKTFDRLSSREKTIGKDLSSTEKDIELFQTEKQKKLNTLDIYVTVQLSQILHMVKYSDFVDSGMGGGGKKSPGPRSPLRRLMSDTASVMSSTMGTPIAAMLMWLVVDVTVVDSFDLLTHPVHSFCFSPSLSLSLSLSLSQQAGIKTPPRNTCCCRTWRRDW